MLWRSSEDRRGWRLQAILLATIVVLVTGALPDALADQQIVAPQGGAASGFSNPKVTIAQGEHLTFRNDDTNVPHNVTAKQNGSDGNPLFQSATVNGGQTVPVNGAEKLSPGTYDFYCSVHPYTMTGTLTVTAASGSGGGGGGGTTGSGGGGGTGTTPTTTPTKSKKHKHKHHHKKKRGKKH